MSAENIVHEAMRRLQSNAPTRGLTTPSQATIAELFRKILVESSYTPSIHKAMEDTPTRYAKFLTEFLDRKAFKFTLFDAKGSSDMQIVNGMHVASLCEHHTLPFFGSASIAYIPSEKIVGLSKLPRLVEYFASGFQTQEYLTNQIGEFLTMCDLKPKAVGVSIRCVHTCMTIRGIKATGSTTTTQYLSGVFKNDPASRAEFLRAVEHD